MTDAELKREIRAAEKRKRELTRLLDKGKITLAELADVDRMLHAEIDRKEKAAREAKNQQHADALKRLIGLLERDAKTVRGRIRTHRRMRAKRRRFRRKTIDRIRRLRKRRRQGGDEFLTGFYHFARPDNNPAAAEAEHFVSTCKAAGAKFVGLADWLDGVPGDLGVCDFEHAPYSGEWLRQWGRRFHELTGVRAVAYGGGYSLNPALGGLGEFSGVWIAAYASAWQPYFSGDDGEVVLWQFTDSASAGGESPVDLNELLRPPGGRLIDTAVYQGAVDASRVASELRGWITKATEGRTYVDPTLTRERVRAMHAAKGD